MSQEHPTGASAQTASSAATPMPAQAVPPPLLSDNPAPPLSPATPPPARPPGIPPPLPAGRHVVASGRRYGFLCSYCSSRLEAVESMAGQQGTCPTCGNSIVIPILDYRGRLIDPTSGQIIKPDPHPVHAYAAAGHKAPQIIASPGSEDRIIRCPRCSRANSLASNNCVGCGLPFTMEGTVGDSISGSNSAAVASLVLGIVGLLGGFCIVGIPPILAIVFGVMALRSPAQATGRRPGAGLATAGIALGAIGILLAVYMLSRMH